MQHTFEMILGKKSIKCRAFTYREFQTLIASKIDGNLTSVVIDTIKNCTNVDATELSKQDAELLFLVLWANSLQKNKFDATWVCDECKKESCYEIDVSKIRPAEPNTYFLDLGKVKIKFRNPKFSEDQDAMLMIVNCIEYIIVDGIQIEVLELKEHEFENIINLLTQEAVETILDELTKNQITLAVPIKCECGQQGVYSITGLSEFFKIM